MRIPRVGTFLWTAVACAALLVAGYGMTACGNGGGTTSTTMSKLTTAITDPAECSAAVGGSYQHVYVTITDVQANASSSAGANGSGWVDLTPSMKPTQVDLLGSNASGGCFLATLGDNLEVQAGTYQQIRLVLGSNSSTLLTNNACSTDGSLSAVNCAQLADGSWKALTTPSAQQTGIKIPASQIAGGSLTVAPGKTEDLVINFKTCESILKAGNSGQYILQPVLNAGQVSTASTSINGTVLDSATGKPIAGANVLVSLEQPDANGVDRIVESTPANATDGTFVFCPVMPGTYDVVVNAYNPTTKVAYNVAVETGVQPGDTTGTINLSAVPYSTATLTGLGTTQDSSSAGIAADLNFYPLEANPVSGASTTYFTIPLLQDPPAIQTATLLQQTTAATYTDPTSGATTPCPTNTYCAPFSMMVPQSGISVYTYSSSGPQPAAATYSTALASYTIDGLATLASDGTTPDCTKPELMTAPATTISAGTTSDQPTPAITTTQALNFTGCQ